MKTAYLALALCLIAALCQGVQGTAISGVTIFPDDHVWNTRADNLPVDSRSADYVRRIGNNSALHPDFGAGLYDGKPIGIPFNFANGTVPRYTVTFEYDDESDPGPYPIPAGPLIEGGGGSDGDRHLLVIERDEHRLYELYAAEKQPDGSWQAGSGAIFDLDGYALRPDGWTSADAAGLAVLPGLVRYDEVAAGRITHAIRFTAPQTRRAFVWPARHYASGITDPTYPPMGQRFRLRASFNTSGYPAQARVILEALREYGMILSDNGGAWFITGQPDDRWDNDQLDTLKQLRGTDFEAVDSSGLMLDPDSGQADLPAFVLPLPGQNAAPADPDGDGIFEDLDGNGSVGLPDVILFFRQLEWMEENEPVAAFDLNGNGLLDFNDVFRLFTEV